MAFVHLHGTQEAQDRLAAVLGSAFENTTILKDVTRGNGVRVNVSGVDEAQIKKTFADAGFPCAYARYWRDNREVIELAVGGPG